MTKSWNEMTIEEKRAERYHKWIAGEGLNFPTPEARAGYQARLQRIIDAMSLKEPDRVPCMLPAGNFPAYNYGIDTYTTMYSHELAKTCAIKFMREFESDTAAMMGGGGGYVNEIVKPKNMKWPGHGLPKNATMSQFVEGEYMKAEDYDLIISDPSDYCLRYYLPRSAGAFEAFRKLMPFRNIMGMATVFLNSCMDPEVQAALQAILDATKEMGRSRAAMMEIMQEALALGLPSLMSGAQAHAPFDIFADTMRGTRGITMDMYRCPDKLLEAMEKITPFIIENALSNAAHSLSPMIFFALHKGDDNFMSDKQFEKFYWPQFKRVIMGFVNEGYVPYLFAEGSFNRRLEVVSDLPRGSVVWLFDRTDMAKAKAVLGDKACIVGNIPSSLMCTGTPEGVKAYCRKLIENCGKGGGYILAGGASVDKSDPRCFHVIMEAAREYGTYKK
jgi:uroporphyrinogen-III decarboxylase